MYLKRHGQDNATYAKDKGYDIKENTCYPRTQSKLLRHQLRHDNDIKYFYGT